MECDVERHRFMFPSSKSYSTMLAIFISHFSAFPPSPFDFHSVHCIFSSEIASRNYRTEIMELIGGDSSSLTLTIGEEEMRRASLTFP